MARKNEKIRLSQYDWFMKVDERLKKYMTPEGVAEWNMYKKQIFQTVRKSPTIQRWCATTAMPRGEQVIIIKEFENFSVFLVKKLEHTGVSSYTTQTVWVLYIRYKSR